METRRITYTPQGGVCSKLMVIDAKDGVIENVQIVGGCHGNGQGMCALLKVCASKTLSVVCLASIVMEGELHARTRWHRH